MGFPIGYTNLFLPKFIIHILTLLGFIHSFISSILHFPSLQYLLQFHSSPDQQLVQSQSFSTVLLRELLPVVKFSELKDPPESCVVCLYEFGAGDEIRELRDSFNERLWVASGIADYYGGTS
ncbi:hypothetical protein L1987_02920 [Smallanthus sonchifolius]|uniref:Uncharacterized protein n=1 Tax=Smallanthus sonchifolius TaxID=185202 RepID=A0ACB9K942_9ASTR|nr:hypothetical protein L1987_02920 [Smallanthus sonchifolius]